LRIGGGALIQLLAQRPSFQQFRYDVANSVLNADVMDREDIGVIEGRNRPRLLLEPAKAIRITGERFRQNLDCDIASETCIAGAIHFTHAARAKRRLDFKRTELRSRDQCHRWPGL
jgi:hypothetical protein